MYDLQVKLESPVDVEKTSRSGRVIKQKKFDDEEVTLTPTVSITSLYSRHSVTGPLVTGSDLNSKQKFR